MQEATVTSDVRGRVLRLERTLWQALNELTADDAPAFVGTAGSAREALVEVDRLTDAAVKNLMAAFVLLRGLTLDLDHERELRD